MTIVGLVPLGDQIAVGKQNGVERLVGVNLTVKRLITSGRSGQ